VQPLSCDVRVSLARKCRLVLIWTPTATVFFVGAMSMQASRAGCLLLQDGLAGSNQRQQYTQQLPATGRQRLQTSLS
jgi:hypothetical protein